MSLSWGKSVTHALWDTEIAWFVTWHRMLLLLLIQNLSERILKMGKSVRTLNLPTDVFVVRWVVLNLLWRARAAKWCALSFLYFIGIWNVYIAGSPQGWGGDEFSHLGNLWLGKYPRYCRGRREILLQEEKKCICMNCFSFASLRSLQYKRKCSFRHTIFIGRLQNTLNSFYAKLRWTKVQCQFFSVLLYLMNSLFVCLFLFLEYSLRALGNCIKCINCRHPSLTKCYHINS